MSVILNDISYSIAGTLLVDHVSVELQQSKLTCVLGANGAGKTTLLKVIAGELKASSGTVSVDVDPESNPSQRRSANYFSVIPQGSSAPEYLTVREMVGLGRFDPESKP